MWGSVGAAGLAAGAVLGGLLTTLSWRLTFLINVPLTLLCAAGALVWVTRDRPADGSVPVPAGAAALGTGAAVTLVLGLTLVADRGWTSAPAVGALALAAAALGAFVRNERTARAVLIEPVLRRVRSLRTGALATALYMASVGSEFYLVTLLLQSARGYSPLRAGLAFLPLAVLVTVGNVTAGRVVRRLGPSRVLTAGFVVAAVGLTWLALPLHGGSYARDLLPGLLISGFGHGVIYTGMFLLGTQDVPAGHQGTAGALLTTSQYLTGSVTVAALTLVLGPQPGAAEFRAAFLVTAAAAVAGALLPRSGPRAGRAG